MTPELILSAGVSVISAIACIAVLIPLMRSNDRKHINRLEGRLEELGSFIERMLRVVYGVETRENHPNERRHP